MAVFGWANRKESDNSIPQYDWDNLHTAARPYCNDLSCWCHVDVAYHSQITCFFPAVTDEQAELAYKFFEMFR